MTGNHLGDDDLIALGSYDDPNETAKEEHLAECSTCMARWIAITSVDEALTDTDSYEEADSRRSEMNEYAALLVREDAIATEQLKDLLGEPARLTWTNLSSRPAFRTGGVVRILTQAAQDACETRPLHALNFADAAIEIAQTLPDDLYPGRAMHDFRGAAWKARANACRYLGRYAEAMNALQSAERQFRKLSHAGIGLSAVSYVRSLIFWEQEEWEAALTEAQRSERGFIHLGLIDRYNAARLAGAMVLTHVGRTDEATAIFADILKHAESTEQKAWIGRASLGLGRCNLDRGDLTSAFAHYSKARDSFRAVGALTEMIRADWGIARTILRQRPEEGLKQLAAVEVAFAQEQMVTDAALVDLDIVEYKVHSNSLDAIAPITSRIVNVFLTAGKMSSALAAAAYLKEAAAAGTLSVSSVEFVRRFIRRVERQPDLAFIPPSPAV